MSKMAVLLALSLVLGLVAGSGSTPHWSYVQGAADGPSNWGTIKNAENHAAYPVCSTGLKQSPINLVANATAKQLNPFKPNWGGKLINAGALLENNGHAIELAVPSSQAALVQADPNTGKNYNLLQFHFHAPSEHTFDGKLRDMEIHMVHQNPVDKSYMVLGVSFVASDAGSNGFLDHFWHHMGALAWNGTNGTLPHGHNTTVSLALADVLPSFLDYFTYSGSFTTPPCTENVTWYVMQNPVPMSRTALTAIRSAIYSGNWTGVSSSIPRGNYRPVLPLNGRQVGEYHHTAFTGEFSGAANACGSAPTTTLFNDTGCAKTTACQAGYCTCIGAGAPTGAICGAFTRGKPNCTVAAQCIAIRTGCLNKASEDSACTGLKDLKMSNLAVAGGQLYNASSANKACKYEACKMLNATASGGNCTLNFNALCASPVKFIFAMLIRGKWSKFLADPVKKALLQTSFADDMSRKLGFTCSVTNLVSKTNRRRQTATSLAVTFEASGVSSNNAELKAAFASAQTDKSFLTNTLAVYVAENGASESFTVDGISAGSASSAVFSAAASKATSKTTGTASPATTAPRGATTTTTGSGSRATTTGFSFSDSSASGAATQSLMAAVAVAVLSALLF